MAFYDTLFQQGMRLTMSEFTFPDRPIFPWGSDLVNPYTKLEKYAAFVKETAIFADDIGIVYCGTKLNGEAGELAQKIDELVALKSSNTNDGVFWTVEQPRVNDVLLELGDVLWYTVALIGELGYDVCAIRRLAVTRAQGYYPEWAPVGQSGVDVVRNTLRINALAGHVGERIGKFIRDRNLGHDNAAFRQDMPWCGHTAQLLQHMIDMIDSVANEFGYDVFDVLDRNVQKLESRRERGKLSGSGDHR